MTRIVAVLLALLCLPALTGCNHNRITAERNALYKQNQELQDKYADALAALDVSENERAALAAQLANQPVPVPVVVVDEASTNNFADIEGIDTYTSAGAIHVRIPGDVLFASGKASLRSDAKTTLADVASVIQREYPGQTIRVEGYTDADPIKRSGWKDNLELSQQRAAAVYRYLASQGLATDMMYTGGFGATHPRETKVLSRRVEIVVLTD